MPQISNFSWSLTSLKFLVLFSIFTVVLNYTKSCSFKFFFNSNFNLHNKFFFFDILK